MAQVTSPIILDSTGQQIHSDLQQIKNVLTTPSAAADITFNNTGTGMQADDVQDAITELKSNLTDLQWTYAGWAIFGQSVTLPADYTEARIYLLFKNSVQSTREIVEMTFFKSLWSEAVNGSITLQPSGYYLSSNDWGYYAVKVTNNGRTFASDGAKWGGMNVDGYSGVIVYYR